MILVIHEEDLSDNEESIIGVADSKSNTESMIKEYYGFNNLTLLKFSDVRDSGIEYVYHYNVKGLEFWHSDYEVKITLMSYELNAI